MKILLRNCDPSENVKFFLQETQKQELQDQNDLNDSLLEPKRKKNKVIFFLHNLLILV